MIAINTREIAYDIFQQLNEEELKVFIALFQGNHSQNNGIFPVTSDETENRRTAFMRMEKLRRPIPGLNEKQELAEYKDEKYGK